MKCFDNIKIPGLADEFKARTEGKNLTEEQLRNVGTQVAKEHFEKLSNDLDKLKTKIGVKNAVKATINTKEAEKKAVEQEYAEKKKKTSAKEVINYKQKKLRQAVAALDNPTDARSAALAFFSGDGKISEDGLGEVVKTRKSYGKGKSAEGGLRDYVGKDGITVDDAAHGIWESLDEGIKDRVDTQDIKNALIDVMGEFDRRNDIREHYIDKYGEPKERVLDDEDIAHFQKEHEKELAEDAATELKYLEDLKNEEDSFEQSPEYIKELIKKYNDETGTSTGTETTHSKNETGSQTKTGNEVSNGKVDKEVSEQQRYATANSWDSFKVKYPKVPKEKYFELREGKGNAKLSDGIKVGESKNTVQQYVDKATSVLNQLFPDHKIIAHETEAEYYKDGKKPSNSYGFDDPETKTIHLNLPLIKELGGTTTPVHEVIHPIVREALESRNEGINEAYDQLLAIKDENGMTGVWEHQSKYKERGFSENKQKIEAITEFLTKVVNGDIDPSKLNYDLSTKIIDIVNKIFKALGIDKVISTPGDLRKLAESIKESFDKADAKAIADVLGKRKSVESEIGNPALADMHRKKIEDVVKRFPDVPKDELIEKFKAKAPEDIQEISDIIDSVRGTEERTSESTEKGTEPPKEPPVKGKEKVGGSDDLTGIKLAETAASREELGLPEYEKNRETEEQWIAQADDAIRNGYDVSKLIGKMQGGEYIPKAFEQVILGKQKIFLERELENNPTPENLAKFKAFVDATDKIAGSDVGKSLRARQIMLGRGDSLGDRMYEEMRSLSVDVLTEKQMKDVGEEFKKEKGLEKAIEEDATKQQEINSKEKAKNQVENLKKAGRTKKTHEERVADRQKIKEEALAKLKAIRHSSQSTVVPYARELFAIAPDVAKYVQSLVEEGVDNLGDIIDTIHGDFKDAIPDITKKDVQDIIAGEYNAKPERTKNELLAKKRDIELESKLLNEINDLENGTKKDKPEKEKIKENKKIAELKATVKELTKKDPHQYEEAYMKRMQKEIDEITEELKQKVITPKPPKEPVQLSERGKALKKELVKLKVDRKVRLLKQEFESQGHWQQAGAYAIKVLNIPRTIMSSMDLSAPLRQGLLASISHPKLAAEASKMMIRALKESNFNEWFEDLKNDPRYEMMRESKLPITDMDNPYMRAREEAFMGGGIAEKVPFLGTHLIKGSERAYVMYLNKMRVDLFNMYATQFEAKGKTYENSKELYHKMAQYVGNVTGRGSLGPLESWGPVLNAAFFSPRLIASRLQMLNPVYVARLPIELKKAYVRDMGLFLGAAATTLGAFMAYAKTQDDDDEKITVETDPRSADFMKIKQGRTRWDILGGFQQYIRAATQFGLGERKSTTTGEVTELDGEGAFGSTRSDVVVNLFRNKLSPTASIIADLAAHKTASGEEVTLNGEAKNYLEPMIYGALKDAYNEGGMKRAVAVGVPSILGVGGSTYKPTAVKENGVKIYNKSDKTIRRATQEEQKQYEELTKKYYNEELLNLSSKGVYKDVYNEVTIDKDKRKTTVPPESLTEEEVKKINGRLKARAAEKAKKELFDKGEESTTKQ